MEVKLEIKKRNRDFGIVTWPYALDFEMKTLFNLENKINVEFYEITLNGRKVSYKYRRFSIGKSRLSEFRKCRYFILSRSNGNIKLLIQ